MTELRRTGAITESVGMPGAPLLEVDQACAATCTETAATASRYAFARESYGDTSRFDTKADWYRT
eukprot:3572510-Pyramimonas_sp.AAC.1